MGTINEVNIRGMVCTRCIFAIRETLSGGGFTIGSISLGKVTFGRPVDAAKRDLMKQLLLPLGFELISDKNEQLLAELKIAITDWSAAQEEGKARLKLSDYLSARFSRNYDSLSEFFSRYEGKTIERFYLAQRIEKVKELIAYTDLPLSEIAFKTGFSSAHHLSAQFKKQTGFNPSGLRAVHSLKRASASQTEKL